MQNPLPDSLEERPLTLGVWMIAAAIVGLLVALIL